jgi:hypothetical protein
MEIMQSKPKSSSKHRSGALGNALDSSPKGRAMQSVNADVITWKQGTEGPSFVSRA